MGSSGSGGEGLGKRERWLQVVAGKPGSEQWSFEMWEGEVVKEGEPVDLAGSGATTLVIGAMTSGAGRSTLGEGGVATASTHKNNGAFA
uniref:Uncharacterized protein n=1 Tax=Tanacetum cinerariifolium TaxID=118510 RepID=A0A6L2JQ01_TANCI|nr:hypothetical protein [Tanacetum cinerariifolium]